MTNAVKHAPGAAVKISVICPADTLSINVRNAAPESVPEPIPGSGLGLSGLRERSSPSAEPSPPARPRTADSKSMPRFRGTPPR